ncbi:heme o synthase [Paenibacillus agaridevorans]|uniref:heme o synthase n=1 Tax=Paenibacillus agaridevorans TaxID=171404 RepID=UPI001BE436BB|nr:heme o synthase [Paenibacillus agaridevorans]
MIERRCRRLVVKLGRLASVLKDLIALTKPRLLRLNMFAAIGGFWVASKWDLDILPMLWMLVGSTLTMASATVVNNYWDRELDQKMERTRNRTLPMGRMSPTAVLSYGIILGIAGLATLFALGVLTGLLGLLGWFVYIVIYTMWLKRSSTWSTSIGGVSGAMPPVIGYCAVTNELDAGAWLLFALLFLWQPAHFWSLAIRRVEEYREAGFPLLPVVKGIKRTKLQMIPYVLLLLPTVVLLYTYGYAGIYFLIISAALSVVWLVHTISGLMTKDTEKWAKINFLISVNYLMIVFVAMIANTVK